MMMKYYRIKDWETLYENNRTKAMKHMQWVPVPVKHDGYGYCMLVSELGASGLGAWLAILQTAAKAHPRGTLLRDSRTPHTATSISIVSRIDKESIQKVLDLCIMAEVGWIDLVDDGNGELQVVENQHPPILPAGFEQKTAGIAHPPAGIAHDPALNRIEGKGIEGMEGNAKGNPVAAKPLDESFLQFWKAYPKKRGRGAAEAAWKKAKGKPPVQEIIAALTAQAQSWDWRKDGGQFVPNPATWINQRRWEDEAGPTRAPEAKTGAGLAVGQVWRQEYRPGEKTLAEQFDEQN